MSEREAFTFDGWAVIEFMGHIKRAGRVRTAAIGGSAVFVVESPGSEESPPLTEIYAVGALYRFTPVTEEVARIAASSVNPAPITPWSIPADWIEQRARQIESGRIAADGPAHDSWDDEQPVFDNLDDIPL